MTLEAGTKLQVTKMHFINGYHASVKFRCIECLSNPSFEKETFSVYVKDLNKMFICHEREESDDDSDDDSTE